MICYKKEKKPCQLLLVLYLVVFVFFLFSPQTAYSAITNFQATPSITSVVVSWAKDPGYSYTRILCDGTEVYAGSGTSTSVSGLSMATRYSFVAESYKLVGGNREYGSATSAIFALTKLGGTLTKDLSLGVSPGPGPYQVRSSLTVPVGITFALGNTELQFISGYQINVEGTLNATDTLFTSDDEVKSAGQWGGISFKPGSTGSMANCTVEYAGYMSGSMSGYEAIEVNGALSFSFVDGDVHHVARSTNTCNAITVYDTYDNDVRIENSNFYYIHNGAGVKVDGESSAQISDSVFDDCKIPLQITYTINSPVFSSNTFINTRDGLPDAAYCTGTIYSEAAWVDPVRFAGNFTVGPSATLRINPSNKVYASGKLIIKGNLLAEGTYDLPIWIGSATNSYWEQIDFQAGSTGVIKHCVVEKAGGGSYTQAINVENAEVLFEHCKLQHIMNTNNRLESAGFRVAGDSSQVVIRNSIFDHIEAQGVRVDNTASPIIENCHFSFCEYPISVAYDINSPLFRGNVFLNSTGNKREAVYCTGTLNTSAMVYDPVQTGDFVVGPSGVLNVMPGSNIFLGSIVVKGTISARGTENNPIFFTRSSPSIYYGGQIELQPGSQGHFNFCNISYLGNDFGSVVGYAAISVNDAAFQFENSTLSYVNHTGFNSTYSPAKGIYVTGDSSEVVIRNSVIKGVSREVAITIKRDIPVIFENNRIYDCFKPGSIEFGAVNDPVILGNTVAGISEEVPEAILVSGIVTSSAIWEDPFSGTLTINPGATLQIKPGTILHGGFNGAIHGNLIAEGTSVEGIYFTTTNVDGWGGFDFQAGSTGTFNHIIAEYVGNAGGGIYQAINLDGADVSIQNSELRYVRHSGFNSYYYPADAINIKSGSSLTFTDSIIAHVELSGIIVNGLLDMAGCYLFDINTYYGTKTGYGLVIDSPEAIDVSGNYFDVSGSSATRYAVRNNSSIQANATDCWWGDATGPYDADTTNCSQQGAGDKVPSCNLVDYGNWKTSMDKDYPPGVVTDLSAARTSNYEADLTWTARGEDGCIGQATAYLIRWHTEKITGANWHDCHEIGNPPTPAATGSAETFHVDDLPADSPVFFALRAVDQAGNLSTISNQAILPPIDFAKSIVLLSANGRETMEKGSPYTISWERHSPAVHVSISYSRSFDGQWNEASDVEIANNITATTYDWTPNFIDGSAWIRVVGWNANGEMVGYDISEYPFQVNDPSQIFLSYPSGTEKFSLGQAEHITWQTSYEGGHVGIYTMPWYDGYWDNDTVGVVSTDAPNTGTYEWTPDTESPMLYLKIVLYDDDGQILGFDISDGPFAVQEDKTVILHGPHRGIYLIGQTFRTTWSAPGGIMDESIVVAIKRDNLPAGVNSPDGKNWIRLAELTNNDGIEDFTIPEGAVSASDWRAYVRHDPSGVWDVSDENIVITRLTAKGAATGINGMVRDTEGRPMMNIPIYLTGDLNADTATAADGTFHFDIDQTGNYRIEPPQGQGFFPQDHTGISFREITIVNPAYGAGNVDFTQQAAAAQTKLLFPRSGDRLAGDFGLFGTAFIDLNSTDDTELINRMWLLIDNAPVMWGSMLGGASDRLALSQVVWRTFDGTVAPVAWADILPDQGTVELSVAVHNDKTGWQVSNSAMVSKADTTASARIELPAGFELPALAPSENISLSYAVESATGQSQSWFVFRSRDGIDWDGLASHDPVITENYLTEDVYPVGVAVIDNNGDTLVAMKQMTVYRPAYKGDPGATLSGSHLAAMGANVVSGNFYYETMDMDLDGIGLPFNFWRRYSSLSYKGDPQERTSLGNGGWGHGYEYTIFFGKSGRRLYLAMPDGHWERYALIDGQWQTMVPGASNVIVEGSGLSGFVLYDRAQTAMHFTHGYWSADDNRYCFKPEVIRDRNGNQMTIEYDEQHRISSILDTRPTPRTIQFAYNSQGFLESVSDGTGFSVSYAYDAQGYLEKFTDRRGKDWTYVYDTFGDKRLLVQLIDPLGNVMLTNVYSDLPTGAPECWDSQWRVVRQSDALNNEWLIGYPSPLLTVVKNKAPQGSVYEIVNTFHINASKMVSSVENPSGGTWHTAHLGPAAGDNIRNRSLPTELQTPRFEGSDVKTEMSYEGSQLGNPQTITDPANRQTHMSWLENPAQNISRITSIQLPGDDTGYDIGYDASGNVISVTDPLNRQATFEYNSRGQLLKKFNPLGNSTTYTYDVNGYIDTVTIDSTGDITQFDFDVHGRLDRVVDPRGNETGYDYNENGQPTQILDADGNTITYTYDDAGNLISTVDRRGSQATVDYNAANLTSKTTVSDGQGHTYEVLYEYDSRLRIDRVINARGKPYRFEYTENGELEKRIDPLGNYSIAFYDADGQVVLMEMRDSADQVLMATGFVRDNLGRITEKKLFVNEIPLTTTYSYDTKGRLATVTDPKGLSAVYTYDVIGRMVSAITGSGPGEEGVTATVVYDESKSVCNGLRKVITDPENNTFQYLYDALGRLSKRINPVDSTWEYTYDAAGNLDTAKDALSRTTTYTYDKLNQLSGITYPGGSHVDFVLDNNGNIEKIQDPLGDTNFVYDNLNRLLSKTDRFGNTVGYEYDGESNITRMVYPGLKSVNYGYDDVSRMTSVTDWLSNTTQYEWDALSRMTQILHANGTRTSMAYDSAGRMIAHKNLAQDNAVISSYTFGYDDNGNRTSATAVEPLRRALPTITRQWTHDAANRLITGPEGNFTYDANGNLSQEVRNGKTITYGYDDLDRLVSWNDGIDTFQYEYDGMGNRVASTENGVQTRYLLDVSGSLPNVLGRTDNSGSVIDYYVHGASGLVSRILPDETAYTYHFNPSASTMAMTDQAGNMVNRYVYTPYGMTRKQGVLDNPFEFVGQFGVMTENNGLHFMRARYYDSESMRFLNQDSVWGSTNNPLNLNLYAYVQGNPVMRMDPSGLTGVGTSRVCIGYNCSYQGSNEYSTCPTVGIAFQIKECQENLNRNTFVKSYSGYGMQDAGELSDLYFDATMYGAKFAEHVGDLASFKGGSFRTNINDQFTGLIKNHNAKVFGDGMRSANKAMVSLESFTIGITAMPYAWESGKNIGYAFSNPNYSANEIGGRIAAEGASMAANTLGDVGLGPVRFTNFLMRSFKFVNPVYWMDRDGFNASINGADNLVNEVDSAIEEKYSGSNIYNVNIKISNSMTR